MKRKNDEVQMKEWVHKLHEAELENLPDKEELQEKYQLSDAFYARMEKLLKRQKKKEVRIRLKHGIAVAAAIAAAVCLIVKPTIAVQAGDVLIRWGENLVTFVFSPDANSSQAKAYKLTYVPDGFKLVDCGHDGVFGDIEYEIGNHSILFYYGEDTERIQMENENLTQSIKIMDNGVSVYYMKSKKNGGASAFIWKSEDGNTNFLIAADLPYEELKAVYDGIKEIK